MTTPSARRARVGRLEALAGAMPDWEVTAELLGERGRALVAKAGDDLHGLTLPELDELEAELVVLTRRLGGSDLVPA